MTRSSCVFQTLSPATANRRAYSSADVIVGTKFDASLPAPISLKLFHVPGAGYDGVDLDALPPSAIVCNCFGHEQAIAEYVMAALLARHVPLVEADRRLARARLDLLGGSGRPGARRDGRQDHRSSRLRAYRQGDRPAREGVRDECDRRQSQPGAVARIWSTAPSPSTGWRNSGARRLRRRLGPPDGRTRPASSGRTRSRRCSLRRCS